MRRYETIIIIDPDIASEQQTAIWEKLSGLVPDMGGFLIKIDKWGSRKLAYEVKKKSTGFYVLIDYCGNGDLVNEMERLCRIDEKLMKYMTVLTDQEPDLDAIKESMRQEKEEAEAKAKAKADMEKAAAQASAKAAAESESAEKNADEKPVEPTPVVEADKADTDETATDKKEE